MSPNMYKFWDFVNRPYHRASKSGINVRDPNFNTKIGLNQQNKLFDNFLDIEEGLNLVYNLLISQIKLNLQTAKPHIYDFSSLYKHVQVFLQ